MITTHLWKTAGIIQETKDTVTVIFDTGGAHFSYEAGQFINITLMINGLPVTRSYSLSSSPAENTNPSITVKKVNGGIMSNFIVDNAAAIGKWRIEGPYGNFTPSSGTYTSRHVVMLAGGSGITPLFSIARSVISRSPDTTVSIIYSSRTSEDIIFKSALDDWAKSFNGRVNIRHVLSQAADVSELSGETIIKGRLNKLVARKLIKQVVGDPLSGVQYFICGPSSLMKMYREVLEAMQLPAENIFLEWFASEYSNEQVTLPQEPQEVLLHFYEQSNLLDVEAGQSILMAALEDKIQLPYSCKTGTCGKCTARLTGGKVKMIGNYALRQNEIDAGLILLCQSYPLDSDVTVEIA